MALMVGTLVLWVGVPTPPGSLWKGVLVLTGRFLPYALFASWLALREVDPRLEEAGRLLGASRATLAARIWGPLSARGVAAAFLLVLVFSLRELDALVLIEPGILPVRIYDKVHFGRTGQVADLAMAYLAVLLVPAVAAVLLAGRRRVDQRA
jgi:iron(III) transport system permease protein